MPNPFFLVGRKDTCQIALGIFIALAESIADPFATIVIGKVCKDIEKFINGVLTSAEFLHNIQAYTYCLVGVTVYTVIVNALGYTVWASNGYKMGHVARSMLYKSLVEQQTSDFDQRSNSAIMHFKDIQDIENAAGITTFELIAMGVGCIVEIGVAFYFSWAVTLVCLAGVPVLIVIGTVFGQPITDQMKTAKGILDGISKRVSWSLSALQTVKIFQKENYEWMWLHRHFLKLQTQDKRYWVLFNLQQGLCRTVVLMIFMQGFYFGSFMVKKHNLSAGNVVSVFWCCLNGTALLQAFIEHLIEWNRGKASAERLAALLIVDEQEELCNSIGIMPDCSEDTFNKFGRLGWQVHTSNKSAYSVNIDQRSLSSLSWKESISNESCKSPALDTKSCYIAFEDVVFSYPQRQEIVLAGLTIEFAARTTTFVLGHSGSGKSTLAAILSKQYPWQAGEVVINDHDVHLLSKNWIEENVYICEQNPKMFDISIKDNIRIGSKNFMHVSDDEVKQALSDSCAEFVYQLPEGINAMTAGQLSGGQQQRISLARARMSNAPIMIFDEVTSALDPALQTEIFNRILQYRKGKTTIVITHDYTVVPQGHPVYIMENGQAEKFNTLLDVLSSSKYHHWLALKSSNKNAKKSPTPNTLPSFPTFTNPSVDKDKTLIIHPQSKTKTQKLGDWETSWKLLKSVPNKPLLFIGLTLTGLHAAINPVFSYCFSKLVMGILDPSSKRTTMWAMLIVMCAILDGLIVFASVVLNFAAEGWLRCIREKLFEKLLHITRPGLSSMESSYYTKLLMSDSEKCAEILTKYWPNLLSMAILSIAGFACALGFGWKLTLVCVSLLPMFVIVNTVYKAIFTYWTNRRESLRGHVIRLMLDITSETGFRTLKVQHLERYFKKLYFDRENLLGEMTLVMVSQIGIGYGFLKCFPYALETLLFWYGCRLIGNGEYNVQQTMTVFSMLMFTVITVDQLTSSIGSVGTGFEALQRLFLEIMKQNDDEQCKSNSNNTRPQKTELVNGNKPSWQKVCFYRVGKNYTDGTSSLGNFNESFNTGETVAIIGPSGIGKSTIARFLLALDTPSNGEIVVDGKWDLNHMSLFDIRQNVSLVSQAPLDFFEGSIEDNLLYGLNTHDPKTFSRMLEICRRCGAHDFISAMKEQYNTRITSGLLSGGQMQRLGIARALLRKPKILILDECTSALDIESKAIVKRMITEMKESREMIVIIITHQMDVAQLADRIVALS